MVARILRLCGRLWWIKPVVQVAPSMRTSCDVVTTLDEQSWVSVHVYIVHDGKSIPFHFRLERLGKALTLCYRELR